jgi:hypothetical protein
MSRASEAYARTQTDDPANRHPEGYYPTPPSAVRALLSVEQFRRKVWECAAGEGHLAEALREAGHNVIATDVVDRGYSRGFHGPHWDFLARGENEPGADIITNPPFESAHAFIAHALKLLAPELRDHLRAPSRRSLAACTPPKVAMFLRLAFLEGRTRGAWFPSTPLARVYVMSARVNIQRGKIAEAGDRGGTMAFAWFVWQLGYRGPPILHFLDWKLTEARRNRGQL